MPDDKIDVDAIIGPVLGVIEQGWVSREFGPKTCWSHAPVVDTNARTVRCNKCGADLDPIDVLAKVAHANANRDYVHAEVVALRKELESLKAEEKRVKARTRSHRNKDARAAVADEKRKQLLRCRELVDKTNDVRRALERIDQLAALIATTPVDTAPALELPTTKEEGST